VKSLRTAITSFFESLLLCQDTIKQFGDSPEDKPILASTEDDAGAQSGSDSA